MVCCFVFCIVFFFFFFKQKTAYEMRISDWSSDVCSSDLDGESPAPCIQSCEVDRSGGFTIMRIIACARLFANRSIPQGQAAGADIDSSSLLQIGRASCRERVCQYV